MDSNLSIEPVLDVSDIMAPLDLMVDMGKFRLILHKFDSLIEGDEWGQAARLVMDYALSHKGSKLDKVDECVDRLANCALDATRNMPYTPPEVLKRRIWLLRQQLFLFGQQVTVPLKLR